ncbi:diguanylate cyclase domain-containing protein [Arenimonas sp.]|uniref:diguanylate cyclase domain-containing protein n=1 Tax=Arenimonas sp. TaxID=1872635 RepID=UPI0035ADFE36
MAARETNSDKFLADGAGPAGSWLRPGRPLFVGLVVLALGMYFSISTARLERERYLSERQSGVQRDLSDFRAQLETQVYAHVGLVRGLAVQVVRQEGISDAEFKAIAAELMRGQPQILNLSMAPGFVVSAVHPEQGNEAAIGLDLLADPVQKHATLRAIREDGPLLAGPFDLRQGGRALAIRIPLWVEREGVPRLWGAVSLVLDHEQVMRDAGILALEKDLRLSIVGRDAAGPGGDIIRGARLPASADAVRVPAFLPGGSWLISAVPQEGWDARAWWQMPGFPIRLGLSLLAALATTRILHDRQRIRRLAGRDALTNLPNRRLALHNLGRMIARGRRGDTRFALLSFDLDGFKPVNDTYGHAAGDLLLAEIGSRLSDSVRPGDLVARMGGDEFLVIVAIQNGDDEAWLRSVAARVQAAISRPVAIDGHWVVVGASIGIARFPEDGDDSESLLRRADEAMYRAKHGRASGVEFAGAPLPGQAPATGD